MENKSNSKNWRTTLLLLVIIITTTIGIALAAELISVEVVAGTDNAVILVEQGQSTNFSIKLWATGKLDTSYTEANPATASIPTLYLVDSGGITSTDFPSSDYGFWHNSITSPASAYRDARWAGYPTPYTVSATISASLDAPIGDYTIAIVPTIIGTAAPKLVNDVIDNLTIRVVPASVEPPPADEIPPETWITSGPTGWINAAETTFTWTGSDNMTPTANLVYSWRLDSGLWSDFSFDTGVNLTGLTEGTHVFEVSAADEADNLDPTPASQSFGVDVTLPVITTGTPTGTLGLNGWWVSNVSIPFSATDNLSGFAPDGALSINLADKTTVGEGFGLTVTSDSISDMAGNAAAVVQAGPFNVDWTAPILSWGDITPAPNAANWNNNVPVTIPIIVTDATSGPASTNPTEVSFNDEGQNQTQSVTVYDNAGNSTTSTSPAVNIDLTPPVVTISLPEPVTVLLNQAGIYATANWEATDNLSGVAGATTGAITQSLATGTVGTRTVDFTASAGTAVDNAGNQSAEVIKTYTYYVHYAFGGISPPVNADGSSVFKLNSTIPIKFQLTDAAGNFVTNAVAKLYLTKISNGVTGSDIEAISTSAATTGSLFRYSTTDNQYIFNLATKPLSIGTWQLRIELDDGTSKEVNISLRK